MLIQEDIFSPCFAQKKREESVFSVPWDLIKRLCFKDKKY
jgi:hypothetical protein